MLRIIKKEGALAPRHWHHRAVVVLFVVSVRVGGMAMPPDERQTPAVTVVPGGKVVRQPLQDPMATPDLMIGPAAIGVGFDGHHTTSAT